MKVSFSLILAPYVPITDSLVPCPSGRPVCRRKYRRSLPDCGKTSNDRGSCPFHSLYNCETASIIGCMVAKIMKGKVHGTRHKLTSYKIYLRISLCLVSCVLFLFITPIRFL